MKMKFGFLVAAPFLCLASGAYAQWPGQSDFSNLNGPVYNRTQNGSVPIYDQRFQPRTPGSWWIAPGSNAKLPPSQYNLCMEESLQMPTRAINCGQ